jgi:hypothetical protein
MRTDNELYGYIGKKKMNIIKLVKGQPCKIFIGDANNFLGQILFMNTLFNLLV